MRTSLKSFQNDARVTMLSREQLKNIVGGDAVCFFSTESYTYWQNCPGMDQSQCRSMTQHRMMKARKANGDTGKYQGNSFECRDGLYQPQY